MRLSTPIDVSQTHARVTGEVFSPFYIIGWVTGGTGLLLLIASVVQPAGIGRYINLAAGITICAAWLRFLPPAWTSHAESKLELAREDAAAAAESCSFVHVRVDVRRTNSALRMQIVEMRNMKIAVFKHNGGRRIGIAPEDSERRVH